MAIQPLDWLGALSLSKRLDCFVVSQSGIPRHENSDGTFAPGT